MGDSLGAERMTCLLSVTSVKLAIEQQWTVGAGHKAGSRLGIPRRQGACPAAELRPRRQVSRQSLQAKARWPENSPSVRTALSP